MGSPVFEQFRRDFFGTDFKSHAEPDLWAIEHLSPHERESAELMLIEALDSDDVRPIIGLGVLKSRRSLRKLRRMFRQYNQGYTTNGFWVAQALWRIEASQEVLPTLLNKLEQSEYWSERVIGAAALSDVNTPESFAALRKALRDPDSLVRQTAKNSLLLLSGIDPESVLIDFDDDQPAALREAIQALEKLLSEGSN